ncbi:arogenate dehydratase/prephenate dehydratase 6, chloroplastic-like [Curcuma longa]|uniref:arogenate dehydratase/prephenate dehydratase 6, chloroplastic-like n=1 Tax=Curcuma longa TaxID=136217 RepID=UPI003D9EDBFA
MTIAVSNHVGAEHPALAAANLSISNRASVSIATSIPVAARLNRNKQQRERRNEGAWPFEMANNHASRLVHDIAVAHLERLFTKQAVGGSSPPPIGDPFGRLPARVAYQGSRGSYCQEVAARAFPSSSAAATLLPCFHMEDAFAALEDLSADRAVVPFENSLDGPIDRNLDLLLRHPSVRILAELVLPVNHCLLSLPGAPISALRRVVSHPQVLSHCRRSLEALDLEVDEVANTADAALFVAENRVADTAVIGSRIAAREFGLRVLNPNFQDRQVGGNFNRFFQLGLSTAAETASLAPAKKKTTLAFALEGGPSDLFSAMWIFERHGVRVARVDHRPNSERPLRIVDGAGGKVAYFDYVFVMDVEGSASDAAVEAAIARLTEISAFTRVLGSYSCTCHSP